MKLATSAYVLLATCLLSQPPARAAESRDKVDSWILQRLESAPAAETDFLIVLAEQADLSAAREVHGKAAKGRFVVTRLRATAERTQGGVIQELRARGAPHRAFWIANMIWARGDARLVSRLAERPDVARLAANPRVRGETAWQAESERARSSPRQVEWNIAHVRAPEVWASGFTGQGVVVGSQDTGVDWDHPALLTQYRGWNGSAADHNHNWHDAIHSLAGGNPCGTDALEPCDDDGHGSLTTGVAVGSDGTVNQIGMAPGAKWIGCRNMDLGIGTPATYSECFQYFLAPTDLAGQNPDPALAPNVINNSWRCPPSEGCTDPNVLQTVVENARAAGIVVVASAGNDGDACSTINAPPAIYDAAFTVGSTSVESDSPSWFSSRGPVTVDGSNRLKPDVAAPGESIRSSDSGGGYRTANGTSLSGPHVTGLVALLIAADPELAGEVGLIEDWIRFGAAQPPTNTQVCGGVPAGSFPNPVFGHGRIDARASIPAGPDFRITGAPTILEVCAPNEGPYTLGLSRFQGFAEPVTFVASGEPAGSAVTFTTNPVTPPGSTAMTVTNTGAGSAGTYSITVTGTSSPSALSHAATMSLILRDAPPGNIVLSSPSDGAGHQMNQPTLAWSAAIQASSYLLELATDSAFAQIVYTAAVSGTSHTVATPLDFVTTFYWRVRGSNSCGDGAVSAHFSFTTRGQPFILLVDDDNDNPDMRTSWEAVLQALERDYEVWDTEGSSHRLRAQDLASYPTVIWFTGFELAGAGPREDEEPVVTSWLESGGRCLFLSSQDYYSAIGLSPFVSTQLGVAAVSPDSAHDTVTGVGEPFGGLGPYALDYLPNKSDTIVPNSTATVSLSGDQGSAAIRRDAGAYRTHFFGFPLEELPTAADRQEVLSRVLLDCEEVMSLLFADGFEGGDLSAWSVAAP